MLSSHVCWVTAMHTHAIGKSQVKSLALPGHILCPQKSPFFWPMQAQEGPPVAGGRQQVPGNTHSQPMHCCHCTNLFKKGNRQEGGGTKCQFSWAVLLTITSCLGHQFYSNCSQCMKLMYLFKPLYTCSVRITCFVLVSFCHNFSWW